MFIIYEQFSLFMELPRIFTTMNLRLFEALDKEEGSLRELAERIGASPGKVHQAASIFEEAGIIETETRRNRRIARLTRGYPLTRQIKALLNVHRILSAEGFEALKKEGRILVYGSSARGTDTPESDLDLLILTRKKELALREKIRKLEAALGRRISPLVMSEEEFARLDAEFAARLEGAIPLGEEDGRG